MINLLPPEEKERLFLENKKKLVIILGITTLIPLVCLVLILSSIRFYMLGEVNTQKVILEEAVKKYQTPDFLTFKEIIEKSNSVVTQVEYFYKKEASVSNALKMILEIQRPPNLYLTNLSLTRDENQKMNIMAIGVSQSRDDLLAFQKNIEVNKEIKNPYFSPESWVNAENVAFKLTFEIYQ